MASRGPAPKAPPPTTNFSVLVVLSIITAAMVLLMWISVGVRLGNLSTVVDTNLGRRLDQLDATLKLMREALSDRADGRQRESLIKVRKQRKKK